MGPGKSSYFLYSDGAQDGHGPEKGGGEKVLMEMKVLLNEEHRLLYDLEDYICRYLSVPNWRRRGPSPDRLYSWVCFLPNHGMDHIMSLWISKGKTQCNLASRTEFEAR